MGERETRTVEIDWLKGDALTWTAYPEQGAWYAVLEGSLMFAPMLTDGSFDPEEIGEVDFYGIDEDAAQDCREVLTDLTEANCSTCGTREEIADMYEVRGSLYCAGCSRSATTGVLA